MAEKAEDHPPPKRQDMAEEAKDHPPPKKQEMAEEAKDHPPPKKQEMTEKAEDHPPPKKQEMTKEAEDHPTPKKQEMTEEAEDLPPPPSGAKYSGTLYDEEEILEESLKPISIKYLEEDLLKILHEDIPDALYADGLAKNVIRWRKEKNIPEDHNIYEPLAELKCGACVSVFNTSFQAINFYSQDPEDHKLTAALLKTHLIDWGSTKINCVLDGVPEKLTPMVNQIVSVKNLEKHFSIKTEMYWMDKERARNLKIECPSSVRLERLTTKQVDYLDRYWPHKFEGSKEYLHTLLQRNLSMGVFQPFAKHPVAWAVCSHSSAITMLFTLETHRGKGYARLLCTAIARKLGEMDIDPRATVLDDNQASKILFITLGYKTGGYFYYIGLRSKLKEGMWRYTPDPVNPFYYSENREAFTPKGKRGK
nr:PREDICTED: uncharacterized protein LOC109031083 [Bemisia tabaci]